MQKLYSDVRVMVAIVHVPSKFVVCPVLMLCCANMLFSFFTTRFAHFFSLQLFCLCCPYMTYVVGTGAACNSDIGAGKYVILLSCLTDDQLVDFKLKLLWSSFICGA